MVKRISILGSTGSIGKSTLEVVRHLKGELEVVALAAHSNVELMEQQAREFRPEVVALYDPKAALKLQERLPAIPVLAGEEGLKVIASVRRASFVMLAMTGSVGLVPALAAIEAGKEIGLANKEILVSGGELVYRKAKEKGVVLLPVDSEHSALFQCLKGEEMGSVRRLILTASGGSLRNKSEAELGRVTVEETLSHPNWKMGPKVTVDTSTLMNKGLELIEARWLFGVDPGLLDVVIHPESRVHSFVEFVDGSLLAQVAEPDMVLPIQYALTYPHRKRGLLPPYDFVKNGSLTFYAPDVKRFPCLKLAMEAMQAGQSYPCFLNGANEVLVERFLKREIGWREIGTKLDQLMSSHRPENLVTLEAILSTDRSARAYAREI